MWSSEKNPSPSSSPVPISPSTPQSASSESRSELPNQQLPKSGGGRFKVRQEWIKGGKTNVTIWKVGGTTKSREVLTWDWKSFKANGLWDAWWVRVHNLGHVFAGGSGIWGGTLCSRCAQTWELGLSASSHTAGQHTCPSTSPEVGSPTSLIMQKTEGTVPKWLNRAF